MQELQRASVPQAPRRPQSIVLISDGQVVALEERIRWCGKEFVGMEIHRTGPRTFRLYSQHCGMQQGALDEVLAPFHPEYAAMYRSLLERSDLEPGSDVFRFGPFRHCAVIGARWQG